MCAVYFEMHQNIRWLDGCVDGYIHRWMYTHTHILYRIQNINIYYMSVIVQI